jgi:hypothetical protein
MSSRPRLTVGSLRGVPQRSGIAPALPQRFAAPVLMPSKRCCGSGCAGCPTGERIRAARRLALPTV